LNKIKVKTDESLFLLYAFLLSQKQLRGHIDDYYLKRLTYNHFKDYKTNFKSQMHHYHYVYLVLMLNKFPSFTLNKELIKNIPNNNVNTFNKSKYILKYLKDFYNNTDFENFYIEILSDYKKECDFISNIFKNYNISKVLDDFFKVQSIKQVIYPMPLEGMNSGLGPMINDTSYAIIGPPFSISKINLIIHEACHARAKKILEPLRSKINEKKYLFEDIKNHKNYCKNYSNWHIYFEEHLVRVIHIAFIQNLLI